MAHSPMRGRRDQVCELDDQHRMGQQSGAPTSDANRRHGYASVYRDVALWAVLRETVLLGASQGQAPLHKEA